MLPASGATKTVESLSLQQQQQQQLDANSRWQYEKGCWEAFHGRDNATARFYKERRSGSAAKGGMLLLIFVQNVLNFYVKSLFLHSCLQPAAVCLHLSNTTLGTIMSFAACSCGAEHLFISLVFISLVYLWYYTVCVETACVANMVEKQLALVLSTGRLCPDCLCLFCGRQDQHPRRTDTALL